MVSASAMMASMPVRLDVSAGAASDAAASAVDAAVSAGAALSEEAADVSDAAVVSAAVELPDPPDEELPQPASNAADIVAARTIDKSFFFINNLPIHKVIAVFRKKIPPYFLPPMIKFYVLD